MLQQMFQDGTLDIKTKAAKDDLIAELYSAESQKIFYDNYALLAGIFENKSTPDNHISLRMNRTDVINLIAEAEIIKPVPEVPIKKDDKNPIEEIPEPQFYEEHALHALS